MVHEEGSLLSSRLRRVDTGAQRYGKLVAELCKDIKAAAFSWFKSSFSYKSLSLTSV